MSDNLKNDIKSVKLIHKDNVKKKEPKFKEPKHVMYYLTENTRHDKMPIKGSSSDKNRPKNGSSASDKSKTKT